MDPVIDTSTPASATPDATVAQPTTPAAAPASPVATPPATPPSATTGTPPQEGWVPSYRIREAGEAATRKAQEAAAREIQQIRAEAERYRQQLHQLVGAQPPADPRVSSVKQEFANLFPGLARLEERQEELIAMLERSGEL